MYPQGLRKLLNWIKTRYNGIDVYIAETGTMDLTDGVRDKTRVEWVREHADEVLKGNLIFMLSTAELRTEIRCCLFCVCCIQRSA